MIDHTSFRRRHALHTRDCRSEKDPQRAATIAWRNSWWVMSVPCIRSGHTRNQSWDEPRPASPSVPHIIGDMSGTSWAVSSLLTVSLCLMRAWTPFHLMLLKANEHGTRDRLQDLHTAMDMHDDAIIRRFCKQKQFAWRCFLCNACSKQWWWFDLLVF